MSASAPSAELRQLESALDASPEAEAGALALDAALDKAGLHPERIRLWEERAALARTPAEIASALVRAAAVWLEPLKDAPRAQELIHRALAWEPRHGPARELFHKLLESTGDVAALAESHERWAREEEGAAASQHLREAAALVEAELKQPARAALDLLRAFRLVPAERGPIQRARALLTASRQLRAALSLLHDERHAFGGDGLAESYAELAELLAEWPVDFPLAREAAQAALSIAPQDSRAKALLAKLDAVASGWSEEVRALRAKAPEERDRKRAGALQLRVAQLYYVFDDGPSRDARVQEALTKCSLLCPGMPELRAFIERGAAAKGDFAGLAKQLEKLTREPQERSAQAELQLRLGQVKLAPLDDAPGALAAFTAAAALDPSRADAALLAAEMQLDAGKPEEAARLLESHLAAVGPKRQSSALRWMLARLYTGVLAQPEKARPHLLEALRADPALARELGDLTPVLQGAEPAVRRELWERTLPAIADAHAQAVRLASLATLCAETGAEPAHIARCYARALVLAPSPGLVDQLWSWAEKASAWHLAARALRLGADRAQPEAKLLLRKRLAGVLERFLNQPEQALALWKQVASEDPQDEQAQLAVERLLQSAGASAEVLQNLEARAAAEKDPEQRRRLLNQLATKLAEQGDKPEKALAVYRQLVDLDANDVESWHALSRAARALSKWSEVVEAAERLAKLAPDAREALQWQLAKSDVQVEQLGEPDKAAKALLKLLEANPGAPELMSRLEALAHKGVSTGKIADELVPRLSQAGEFQRAVKLLEAQLAQTKKNADREKLHLEIAHLREQKLADNRAALAALTQASRELPNSEAIAAEISRLARDLGSAVAVVALWLELSQGQKPAAAAQMALRAAKLAEDCGETECAIEAYRAALARKPDDAAAQDGLLAAYKKQGRWAECEKLLRARAEAEKGPARAAAQLALADILERLDRPADVAVALEQAIAAGADEAALLARLGKAHEAAGDLAALEKVLAREVALAEARGDADQVARLNLRRTRLFQSGLGDRAAAVKGYADVLAARPSDPEALAALEAMLGDGELREKAARALIPAYEAMKEHRRLVQALDVLGEAAEPPAERVGALKRAALIYSNDLRQPEMAFGKLARALQLAPGDAAVRMSCRRAAEDADCVAELADILAEAAQAAEGTVALPLHRELAELCERRLGDRARAIEAYRKVLAVDAENLDALRGLHRLLRADEKFAELAGVCRQLAEVVYEDQEKLALLREAGTLCEGKLDDAHGAAAAFQRLVELDAHDKEAASALERLYEKLQRPKELAAALELRRTQEGPGAPGRELAFKLAALQKSQLGDAPAALRIFAQILAEDAAHGGARAALEAWIRERDAASLEALALLDPVLAKSGDHAKRVALREALAEGAPTELKARLFAEIRGIYLRELAQPEMAFMSACRAFAQNVERAALLPELENLARETNAFEELCEIFEDALGSEDDAARAELLARRAANLRAQLGEPERAIELWNGLLQKKPGDREALDALTALYEKSQSAQNLAALYRQKAQLATDAAERVQLLLQSATARDQTGDAEGAAETLREALALDPKRLDAWTALDALHARLGKPLEHAEVLKSLAELSSGAVRRTYLIRRAMLLEKHGGPQLALDAYVLALAESPSDANAVAGLERLFEDGSVRLEVARLLEPIYRATGESRRLADVLDALIPTAADRRMALLKENARLRETLDQKPLAFALLLGAFREAPDDAKTREDLERLAADTGSFEELAAAYQDALEREVAPELAVVLWRGLAALYAERLGAMDEAAKALEQVAAREPDDATVLEQLARIYRRQGALPELAAVMRRQVSLEPDAHKKRDLLDELAALCQDQLADPAAAIDAYQQILGLTPADAKAMSELHELLAGSGRWDELAEHMNTEIEQAKSQNKLEEACELMVRLGKVHQQHLGDPRRAFDIYRNVLADRPGHAGALGALEEMAKGDGPLHAEAALALEPIFTEGGDHQRLVQVLEARAAAAAPQERSALLRRVAEVYAGPLGSPEMAFVAASRALRELPDDVDALGACQEYVEAGETHEELEALISEVIPRATTDEARIALYRAQAALCRGPVKDLHRAADAYLRILEIRPSDAEALDQLSVLLLEQGEFETLLEIFRRKLALAQDDAQRTDLLLRMAELQEEKMRDAAGAIATLNRLLAEVNADDRTALARLDFLCAKQERWVELADVLARELALAEVDKQTDVALELKGRLAELRETRLQDRNGALALYKQILEQKPDAEPVIARLEAMLQREPNLDEAAAALEGAYRHINDNAKLAQILEQRAANAADSFEKKRIYTELAVLRAERQNRPELAFIALCRAFREDPTDAQLRRTLERVATAAESEEELVALYEEELPRVRDEAAASDIALRAAMLLEQKLGRPEDALPLFEQALALDAKTAIAALPALDRAYRAGEQWDKLAEVLRRAVDAVEEPREKVLHLLSLGQLLDEKLANPDRAAEAFEEVLKIDPKSMPALRGLEKLYDAAQHWDRLYKVLEIQRDIAPASERERVMARMAQVAGHGLSDQGESIRLYEDLLAKNPRSEPAIQALEGLYESAERWQELAELIRKKLAFTVDPREIVRLNDKLGHVLFAHLEQLDEAVVAFKAVLDRDPRHKAALESLRDIYKQLGRTDDLVTMLRRLIPVQDDQGGVKQVRIELAEVLAAANRKDEALDAARRVLDVEPHVEADLLRAEELFRKLGAFADQVKAMELRAELAEENGDGEAAVNTFFNVAETWTVQLKKREMALAAYDRILGIDHKNRLAFEQLRSLAKELGDWRRYTTTTDRFLPAVTDAAERLALLKETAKLQIEKLGQKDLAFLTYCRAFKDAPDDAEIRAALAALAGENDSWEELAMVYEEAAEGAPKGPVAESIYAALAEIQDVHLDEPEAAEASLRKILEFDPANRTALDALGKMHSRRGKDSDYIASLEQKLEVSASIDDRKAVLREIARVHDERRNDPESAVEALQRALALEADRATIDVLATILRREKNWNELVQALIRARDLAAHPSERAELQHQVAEIYERDLNDDEAAIAGYRQAIEFDPTHRESIASLEKIYTRLDRSAELLGVYNQQLEFVTEPKERIKILFKCAGIWEDKYQNLANADACLVGILEIDPRNLQAIKDLQRLKRAQGRWDELVQVYDRHLALIPPAAVPDIVELLIEQGDVWYHKLSRVDRAAEVYNQALTMQPQSKAAMHALGILYERSGNWPFALDMLGREAELEHGAAAVELWQRTGKIHEEMLLDAGSAKAAYQRALKLDPMYLPALRQLKGIFQIEKDEEGYLQTLIQEARATHDAAEKTAAWIAVGDVYRENRDDRDSAATHYEEALKVTPDSLIAARHLADIYVAKESWERAEQMLDIVGVKLGDELSEKPEGAKDFCRQLYRLGYVCEKLGKQKKALEAYRRAYELDATYLPALEGLGHLLVQAGEFDEANKVYQTILLQHREDLTDLEVVEIYWQLGEICLKLKTTDRALNYFEKALAIDPAHEPSQRAMIALAEELGQYEKSLQLRRKLAEVLDGDELFGMQTAIAKICRDQLHDPFGAIDAFGAALKAKPEDLATLDQLLALYRDTHQGEKAVEVLTQIIEHPDVEKDASARKKGFFTLGEIYRDELKDDDQAIDAFNRCLDVDPKFVNAFSAIEQLLAARKQWKKLEENYAAMIKRLPKTEETHAARMALWRTLADLYLRVLKNPQAAMLAYEVVAKASPDDAATIELYAQLAAEQPDGQEKAIDAYRRAMPLTANPGKAASAMAKLHALRKEYDGAFTAAQVVVHLLGEGGPEEREILTKLTPFAKRREVLPKDKVMTDRMWAELVFHPKVRGPMGEIFALLQTQAGMLWARKLGDFRVDPRKHRIDLASGEELAVNTFRNVSHVLHLDSLELYSPYLVARRAQIRGQGGELPPEQDLGVELLHSWPLSAKAGGALFKVSHQKELQFHIGKALAFARPELALARSLPLDRLEAVFQAAIVLVATSYKVTADPRVVEQERRGLEKSLTDPAKQALARLVRAYLKVAALGDVRAFVEGAELTANRAGALLAGNVEASKAVLEKEQGTVVRLPLRSKIRDLMVFCLSGEYAQLREALGINVVVFTGNQPQAR